MGWREELLEASLGTVKFKVRGTDVEAGRLHAVHRFAGSKQRPWVEDLGVGGETFSVDAYVLGDDYLEQRRKLLEIATRPSTSLRLTLPTWAPRIVFCTGVRIRETSDELRLARFELSFRVVDDQVTIARAVKPAQDAETKAKALEDQAATSAEANLELEGVPDHVREGAAEGLRATGRALLGLDLLGGAAAEVGDVTRAANHLISDALELATAPADLVSQTLAAVQGVAAALADAPGSALEAYRVLMELEIPAFSLGGLSGSSRDRNAIAVRSLVRQVALAGYTRAAVEFDWKTREDAELARARALEAIDLEAETVDDAGYKALLDLRAALMAAVPPEDQDLPNLVRITPAGDTTTLAIAYRLYDDPARDDEIRERNRIRNPALVPPGVELEVLSK